MHAGVAEGLAEQLARTVDDARLTGEVGGAGHETDDLDHADDLVEVADDRLHRGDRVERARLAASSLACSGVTSPPTLPVAGMAPATIGSWPEV